MTRDPIPRACPNCGHMGAKQMPGMRSDNKRMAQCKRCGCPIVLAELRHPAVRGAGKDGK